jgi:hypothetical protein
VCVFVHAVVCVHEGWEEGCMLHVIRYLVALLQRSVVQRKSVRRGGKNRQSLKRFTVWYAFADF